MGEPLAAEERPGAPSAKSEARIGLAASREHTPELFEGCR